MIKVGYIDDKPVQFENYQRKLRREGIELIAFEISREKSNYLDQIYQHQVEALLIDYKMVESIGYNGSTLISYISDEMPDITCFILTAAESRDITDKLVAEAQIYSKEVFDTEAGAADRKKKFRKFVDHVKDCAEVFQNRREIKCSEYVKLLKKRETKEGLSAKEEEEFCRLYKCLSSYGMVEKLPNKFLQSDFDRKLDSLLEQGAAILQQK